MSGLIIALKFVKIILGIISEIVQSFFGRSSRSNWGVWFSTWKQIVLQCVDFQSLVITIVQSDACRRNIWIWILMAHLWKVIVERLLCQIGYIPAESWNESYCAKASLKTLPTVYSHSKWNINIGEFHIQCCIELIIKTHFEF